MACVLLGLALGLEVATVQRIVVERRVAEVVNDLGLVELEFALDYCNVSRWPIPLSKDAAATKSLHQRLRR